MALKVNMVMTTNKVLTALGFSYADIKAVENAGVEIKVKNNALEVYPENPADAVSIKVSGPVLLQLKQNALGSVQRKVIHDQLKDALQNMVPAFKALGEAAQKMGADIQKLAEAGGKVNVGALDILKKAAAEKAQEKVTEANNEVFENHLAVMTGMVFPPSDMSTAPCVKLRDAELLYQPVNGTNAESRYFCVGVSQGLKVGARYLPTGKLSVRVEGPDFGKYLPSIKDAGFDPNVDMGYASIHVNCPNITAARHALGALMFGLGVQWLTPTPMLDVIQKA